MSWRPDSEFRGAQGNHIRDLRGPRASLLELTGGNRPFLATSAASEMMTLEDATTTCAAFCRGEGYTYMGLQWKTECRCDNQYGTFGVATADAEDGFGVCDVTGPDGTPDGIPDCGHSVPSPANTSRAPFACGYRNAIYDLGTTETPTYVGCYLDGQATTTCSDAKTCTVCALMADEGCGWNSRSRTCRDGSWTSPDECAVSEYGFPAGESWLTAAIPVDNPPGCSCKLTHVRSSAVSRGAAPEPGTFWAWTRNASTNVLYPDPTRLPANVSLGFTLDETYEPASRYSTVLTLVPGFYIFIGNAEEGVGWHGGYWEVTDSSGNTIAGGASAGLVNGAQGFGAFPVADTNPVTLTIQTGTEAADVSWKVLSGVDQSELYAGPAKGTLRLGGGGYYGAYAGLTILSRSITEEEADCLYRDGSGRVEICEATDWLHPSWRVAYSGSMVDGGPLPDQTTLNGDAYHDRNFGIELDGDEDYVTVDGSTGYYAMDGTFTISLWFSKVTECDGVGSDYYESLFSHQYNERARVEDAGDSSINIEIGCAEAGVHSTLGNKCDDVGQDCCANNARGEPAACTGGFVPSTQPTSWDCGGGNDVFVPNYLCLDPATGAGASGRANAPVHDIIRTWLVDEDLNRASFDVSLNDARSGSNQADQWVHLVLSVSRTSIVMYIDGQPVSEYGFQTDSRRATWMLTAENLAWPDPTNLPIRQFRDPTEWRAGGCYCSGASDNGRGNTCMDETQGSMFCYTRPGACSDGQASQRVPNVEWSLEACVGVTTTDVRPTLGRFANSGYYNDNHEYTIDVSLSAGRHTFTPVDPRNENWSGGHWWIEDNEVVLAEGNGRDVTNFTVAGSDALLFGPPCNVGYHDFDVFNQSARLAVGTYYMVAGGGTWDGLVDQDPAATNSYWSLLNADTGALVAGGPGSGNYASSDTDTDVTEISIATAVNVIVQITTFSKSGIRWGLGTSADGSYLSACSGSSYTLHVMTGIQRSWEVGWAITDSAGDEEYSGPRKSSIYFGSDSRKRDRYFEGSIAQMMILTDPIAAEEADCMYRSGILNLGTCPSLDETARGRDWYGTFLGDSSTRYLGRDMDGLRTTVPLSDPDRVNTCGTTCYRHGFAFMGLQGDACWCDDDYGSRGEDTASRDCDEPFRNWVYSIDGPTNVTAPTSIGCYVDGVTPIGSTLQGGATDDQVMNFGVTLNGESDWVEIDTMSQTTRDENYCKDGSFSLSFWFWKRECTVAGEFEYLYSHQNNSADIYNEPRADASWSTIEAVIHTEEERLAWLAADPEIDENPGCFECTNRTAWSENRGSWRGEYEYMGASVPMNMTAIVSLQHSLPLGLSLLPFSNCRCGVSQIAVSQIDQVPYMVYPMYLCLDNAGHPNMDTHRTVESFLRWKCSLRAEDGSVLVPAACEWKTWQAG